MACITPAWSSHELSLKVLYNFLNDVCPLDTINFWNKRDSVKSEKAKAGRNAEFST